MLSEGLLCVRHCAGHLVERWIRHGLQLQEAFGCIGIMTANVVSCAASAMITICLEWCENYNMVT